MLDAEKRMDQDAYSLYDSLGGAGSAGLRFSMGGLGKWALKGFGQLQKYTHLKEFDFEEYQATCQINRAVRTRTTVIGQIQAGTKHYLEPVVVRTIEITPSTRRSAGNANGGGRTNALDRGRVIWSRHPKRLMQAYFIARGPPFRRIRTRGSGPDQEELRQAAGT
jgi:hypothetical protein